MSGADGARGTGTEDDGRIRGEALRRARLIVGALAFGVLVLAGVSGSMARPGRWTVLAAPAALMGIVSPVLGYRLYLSLRDGVAASATLVEGCATFVRANVVASAVTEGVAFFGVMVFILTGRPEALIGVVTHIVLAGAIWPTEEKLEPFIERDRHARDGGV